MTEETFGAYVRRMREDARLSLREAAPMTGIHNSYLNQIETQERNPPSYDKLRAMARAYHLPVGALLQKARLREAWEQVAYYDRLDDFFAAATAGLMVPDGMTAEAKRLVVELWLCGTPRGRMLQQYLGSSATWPKTYLRMHSESYK